MPAQNKDIRVLIVEDNEDDYILFRTLLDELPASYDIAWASTYQQALDMVGQHTYDLMFFDYSLGPHTGLSLLQEPLIMRQLTPVIMLTGQAEPKLNTQALRAGATDYLEKTELNSELLERTIDYTLERQRNLEQLRQSEARYRAVVDGQTEFLIRFDTEFVLTFVNQAYCDYRGHPSDVLLGSSALATIDPSDQPKLIDALQNCTSATPNHAAELKASPADEPETWHYWKTRAMFDNTGNIHEYQSVIRDMTERKRVEEALNSRVDELNTLRRVDAELTDTLDMISVKTLALDSAMRLSGADVAVLALYDEDIHTLKLQEAYGVVDRQSMDQTLTNQRGVYGRALQNREPLLIPDMAQEPDCLPTTPKMISQMIIPLISQERFMGLISLETPLPERFSQEVFEFLQLVTARIAVALDNARLYAVQKAQLEELQTLYEQVSDLEQLKTDMIRIASHDLRNPIGVMQSYIEMLQSDIQGGKQDMEKFNKQLDVMKNMARRMRKITSDILSVDRIEQTSHNLATSPLDLTKITREVADEYRFQAKKQQHDYTILLPDSPTTMQGDPAQMREAIANLINNAIKYTPTEGSIQVALEYDGDAIIFEVIDSGYGVPEDMQSRLFQPFSRVRTKETANIEGTGLGLHLVKNIVERHGGRMIFRTEYGQGSTFGFQIPTVPHE